MKQKAVLLVAVLFTAASLSAQKYTTAAGIRVGSGIGLTVQQHLWDKYTLEGIAQKSLLRDGMHVAALFERHNKLFFKGLNFYIGAGPHFNYYGNQPVDDKSVTEPGYIKNAVGISAIGGFEMRFKRLVLSYDFQPGINFTGGPKVLTTQTGVSARYILVKAKKAKKKDNGKFWDKFKKITEDGDE
ncbi:MAG: hypothetical protein V4717_13685 [Bacteroidota bacterium]